MTGKGWVFAFAVVACAGARSKIEPLQARSVAAAPTPAGASVELLAAPAPPPVVQTLAAPALPPVVQTLPADPDTVWARLQTYLPALEGADHEREFHLVGAFAVSPDADTHWRQLVDDLSPEHGGLGHTCAGPVEHVVALVIDDPTTTRAIGRPGPEVRVFWMPLAHVAGMTVGEAIRAAGLVDGPSAAKVARDLRRGRTPAAWVDAVERSEAWFLPAGDDPTIYHRRIRGYAVATLPALRRHLVYVGVNVLGFCEVATLAVGQLDGFIVGAVHGGADVVCDLPGVHELAECRR